MKTLRGQSLSGSQAKSDLNEKPVVKPAVETVSTNEVVEITNQRAADILSVASDRNTLVKMQLHELRISSPGGFRITRVLGGWIYERSPVAVFVPER